MTTSNELIEWLKQFPGDSEVELIEMRYGGYNGGYARWTEVDLDQYNGNVDVMDLRNNPFVENEKDKKVFIRFGRD